jgi:hypothetical protein
VSDFAISSLPALVTQAAAISVQPEPVSETTEVKVDLRQALSFVIDDDSSAEQLSDEEVSALEQRRLDLIMWLLNLELRLSPYCTDFA